MFDNNILSMVLKLVLAVIFGGIIGFERESLNRPAGFRTHILVCVGSALVMATSAYIFELYKGITNLDPARLGAQVISGIGFLGAGTIIKDNFKVRGLTTAASLWSVACVGLAVGSGYYEGAAVATILIVITLNMLKKMEERINARRRERAFYINAVNTCDKINEIVNLFDNYEVKVGKMEFNRLSDDKSVIIKIVYFEKNARFDKIKLINDLYGMDGINKVSED